MPGLNDEGKKLSQRLKAHLLADVCCSGDIYMNNKACPICTESSQFLLFPGSALYSGLS